MFGSRVLLANKGSIYSAEPDEDFYFFFHGYAAGEMRVCRWDTGEVIYDWSTNLDVEGSGLFLSSSLVYAIEARNTYQIDDPNAQDTISYIGLYGNRLDGSTFMQFYTNPHGGCCQLWDLYTEESAGKEPPKNMPIYPAGFPWTTTEGPIDLRSLLGGGLTLGYSCEFMPPTTRDSGRRHEFESALDGFTAKRRANAEHYRNGICIAACDWGADKYNHQRVSRRREVFLPFRNSKILVGEDCKNKSRRLFLYLNDPQQQGKGLRNYGGIKGKLRINSLRRSVYRAASTHLRLRNQHQLGSKLANQATFSEVA